ncbi:MAG: hypothetical protein IJI54_10495 [Kiritimatiellae bacterium]|nr:hypothetical protein [Kiritimatiellia bacterium]
MRSSLGNGNMRTAEPSATRYSFTVQRDSSARRPHGAGGGVERHGLQVMRPGERNAAGWRRDGTGNDREAAGGQLYRHRIESDFAGGRVVGDGVVLVATRPGDAAQAGRQHGTAKRRADGKRGPAMPCPRNTMRRLATGRHRPSLIPRLRRKRRRKRNGEKYMT